MKQPVIIQVALFSALRQILSYLSVDLKTKDYLGRRVLVPLGSRNEVGIVVDLADSASIDVKLQAKLKPMIKFLDALPLFSALQLKLASWMSSFYLYPIGQVLEQMLPAKLRSIKVELGELELSQAPMDHVKSLQVNLPSWQLSSAQTKVLSSIDLKGGFKPYLLFGSTNSGKTEIYLRLTEAVLASGRQVLMLVPEISLTPQTIKRFIERFSSTSIVISHSKLTPKARLKTYLDCYTNRAQLVIGTRSALFLPLEKLGLILIDEEHDSSFKQESDLRYSASEVSLMLAKYLKIPILLGSATPSVTSWQNAINGRYQLLTLPPRGKANNNLTIEIVNTAGEKLCHGFSARALKAMEDVLSKHQQVVVFLNRRGYAAKLVCPACNWQANCPYCDAPLTLHRLANKLVCHHCQFQRPMLNKCPSCHGAKLSTQGAGTEKLEAALGEIFPQFSLARIDSDSIGSLRKLEKILSEVASNRYQILVGTQILAKGHHFPNISLVVVMNVDSALFSEDFHQEERLAQLLTQVMGRAGRGNYPGRVMIQTNYPKHPFFEELTKQDYTVFLTRCLNERQEAQLPPFSCHAILQAEARLRPKVYKFLNEVLAIARRLNVGAPFTILGPAPLRIERKTNRFRARLVLQATNYLNLHKVLINLDQKIAELKKISGLKWFFELNPLSLLEG